MEEVKEVSEELKALHQEYLNKLAQYGQLVFDGEMHKAKIKSMEEQIKCVGDQINKATNGQE